ncbi:MAG: hypothetical protein H7839_10385 [Magnetococcus sp. YQC-5]
MRVHAGLLVVCMLFAITPAAFFMLIVLLSHHGAYDILLGRRMNDKIYFGLSSQGVPKRDRMAVWYQMLLISSYGYVLACHFIDAFFYLLLIFSLSIFLQKKLTDPFSQRRFFYRSSILFGFGYSVLGVLTENVSFVSAMGTLFDQLVHWQIHVCVVSQIFTAFNALSASIIHWLPFPLNVVLVPLNLHLLYGPLVAVGVLGLLKTKATVEHYWFGVC